MANLSKVKVEHVASNQTLLKFVCGISSVKSLLFLIHLYKKSVRSQKIIKLVEAQNKSQNKNTGRGRDGKKVGKQFIAQLQRIFKILVPRWNCPEVGYMGLVSVTLVIRALCDLWTIYLGTLIESAIICGEPIRFNSLVKQFAMTMPTMTLTNATLKYSIRQLEIRFRSRLTRYLMSKYMYKLTFYKINQAERNIDQLITTDVEKFTTTLANLYSQMSKPLLDIIIYVYGISSSIGASVPGTMLFYLAVIAAVIAKLRRPMAKLTATEQSLEGEFRFGHSRIITNSEEIAFYKGGERELDWMLVCFNNLYTHLNAFTGFKFLMEFFENILAKYAATCVGYYAVSRPFFVKAYGQGKETPVLAAATTHQQRQEVYYKSGRMLLNLALAMGRFILNTKDLTKLAGYTSRVSHLLDMLSQINSEEDTRSTGMSENAPDTPLKSKRRRNERSSISSSPTKNPEVGVGRYVMQNRIIRFQEVPIVTPNGDVLVKALTMEVKSGTNVLVCGPNGCGKSSLFRILGELWPLRGGILTKPRKDQLFYVPQKPYMPYGTFRDQIIYPDTKKDMDRKGRTDEDLLEYLRMVDLEYLVDLGNTTNAAQARVTRALKDAVKEESQGASGGAGSEEGNNFRGSRHRMDAVENWMDVLSGGQKQRIAMARMFYHKPQFAILDECTSAVSVDVEGAIYRYCRAAGITLFTVSHRKSLWAYHDYVLHMDGRGDYSFNEITRDEKGDGGKVFGS